MKVKGLAYIKNSGYPGECAEPSDAAADKNSPLSKNVTDGASVAMYKAKGIVQASTRNGSSNLLLNLNNFNWTYPIFEYH